MPNDVQLFTAQTSNASSSGFNAIGAGSSAAIQETFLEFYGTFDGASLQLEYKAKDGTYYSTGDTAITAPCAYFAKVNSRVPYRVTLSSAGASTSVSVAALDATAAV